MNLYHAKLDLDRDNWSSVMVYEVMTVWGDISLFLVETILKWLLAHGARKLKSA